VLVHPVVLVDPVESVVVPPGSMFEAVGVEPVVLADSVVLACRPTGEVRVVVTEPESFPIGFVELSVAVSMPPRRMFQPLSGATVSGATFCRDMSALMEAPMIAGFRRSALALDS
jgi:hypothetical protein